MKETPAQPRLGGPEDVRANVDQWRRRRRLPPVSKVQFQKHFNSVGDKLTVKMEAKP